MWVDAPAAKRRLEARVGVRPLLDSGIRLWFGCLRLAGRHGLAPRGGRTLWPKARRVPLPWGRGSGELHVLSAQGCPQRLRRAAQTRLSSSGEVGAKTGVLERIALHQTRLHTPGLGLDAKGVALGAKGLVLLPSIDRLVALLAVYTRERSLEDIMPSLVMRVVRSKLGTREITLELAAESSDRMDRVAETARVVGGFTFTGTSRHFVQYRDAGAPFGYDATELLSTEAAIVLYHDRFSQTYDVERDIQLRPLLLRLMPHVDPSTKDAPGVRILVGEQGLGPALVHYLVRSRVEGDVGVAEWPPESAFDDALVRRWIFRIPELPDRMR